MLLRSPDEAGDAAAKLERFRLANRDAGENLVLGLLADLRESSRELEERDDPILAAAKAEIDRLNGKYGGGFCLLCRKLPGPDLAGLGAEAGSDPGSAGPSGGREQPGLPGIG